MVRKTFVLATIGPDNLKGHRKRAISRPAVLRFPAQGTVPRADVERAGVPASTQESAGACHVKRDAEQRPVQWTHFA